MMTARRSEHSVMFILYVILTIVYQVNTLQGDLVHPSERQKSTKFVDQGNHNLQHLNGAKRKYKWEMPHIWRDPEDFFIVDSFENENYGSEKKLSNDQDYDNEKQSVIEVKEDIKDLENLDSVLQQKKQEKMFESPVGYGMLVSGSDEDISSDLNVDTNAESDALKNNNEESGLPHALPNFPKKINLYSWNSKKNIGEGNNMKNLFLEEQNVTENNVEGTNFKKVNSDQLSFLDENKLLQSKKTINKNLDKNKKSRKSFINDDSSAENIGYNTNKGQHEKNKDNISPDLGKASESRKHVDINTSPKGQNLINKKFGHDLKIQAWGYLNISSKDSTTAATIKTDGHELEETGIPPKDDIPKETYLQDILEENTEDSEEVVHESETFSEEPYEDEEEKEDVSQNGDKIFGLDIEQHRGQELQTDAPEEEEADSTEDEHDLVEHSLWYDTEGDSATEEDTKDKESSESDKVQGDDIWLDLKDTEEETISFDDTKKETENKEDVKEDDILDDENIKEDDKEDPWFTDVQEEKISPTEDFESSDVSDSSDEIADTDDPWISHHEKEDEISKHEHDQQGPDVSGDEKKKDIYADPWFGNISRPDDDQKKTEIDSRCLPCLNIHSRTNKAGCTLTLIQIHIICSQDETSMGTKTDSTDTKTCILEDLLNVEDELGDEKSLGASLTDVSVDIWSSPAAYMIPSAWVHEFLLQDQALTENITYAKHKCESAQVVDWNCMYYELGGGDHSFSMSHLVNLFKRITNKKISNCLLNAVENCHDDWSVLRKEIHDRIWLAELQSEVLKYMESHQTSSDDTSSHHSSTEYNEMKNILFSIDHHLMPNLRNREEALKLQTLMSLQEKVISACQPNVARKILQLL